MKNKFLDRTKRLSRILIPFALFSAIGVGLTACLAPWPSRVVGICQSLR